MIYQLPFDKTICDLTILVCNLVYICRFKSSFELMLICYDVLPTQNKIYLIKIKFILYYLKTQQSVSTKQIDMKYMINYFRVHDCHGK